MRRNAVRWTTAGLALVLVATGWAKPDPEGMEGPGGPQGPGFEQHDGPGGGPRGPGMDPHGRLLDALLHGDELAAKLGLSADQVKTLRDAVWEVKRKEVDLRAELEKAGMDQARILMGESVDEEALMKAIERTGGLRTELAKLRVAPLVLLKKTLTAEQLAQARKLVRAHMQKRRQGGEEPGKGKGKWHDRKPRPPAEEGPAPEAVPAEE